VVDAFLLSVISACTALVASVLGPAVTLAVAKRQVNANVLSANRQKWIESVRDLLAELISLFTLAGVLRATWKDGWAQGMGPVAADAALREKLERLVLVTSKIRLMINPAEPDHQELYRTIEAALLRFKSDDELREADTHADVERITLLAQAILKREWQRVKLGV
jgi:hypothetical protein